MTVIYIVDKIVVHFVYVNFDILFNNKTYDYVQSLADLIEGTLGAHL